MIMSARSTMYSLTAALPLLAGLAAAVAPVGQSVAFAQAGMKGVDPHVMVVTAEAVQLRAGNSTFSYSVGVVKAGTMLRVDGDDGTWLRVSYPAGSRALATADDLVNPVAGQPARLKKPSRLLALNSEVGPRGSFMPLLATDLAPDTSINVLEAVKSEDTRTAAFYIQIPDNARAFIDRGALRKATEEETAKFAGLTASPSAPAASNPATPAAPTTPSASTAPSGAVVGSTPVPPGFTPVNPGSSTTVINTTDPASGGTTTEPATTPQAPVAPPAPRQPSRIEQLNEMFDRVWKQPAESAELDEAIAELRGYVETLTSSPADRAVAKSMQRRISALELRRDLRNEKVRQEETRRTIDTKVTQLRQRILELESQRVYTVIGRLIPSAVYDGSRLPMLYRIESPEPGSARTLGYLQPDPKLDLSSKLGVVVGIEGEIRFEDSLKANIITARKVDQISLEPVQPRVVGSEQVVKTTTTSTTTTTTTQPAQDKPQEIPSMVPVEEPK
ncbi:MAG: SH3 domain-containing protein [Phycisphaerales bacterium]|nr:SH3 domain-containing protein [Phycisphaerales bacterium]